MKIVAACCVFALTGCTVGPQFESPRVDAPATYGEVPGDVAHPIVGGDVDLQWWRAFNDPRLSALVERLGRQNLDLQEAAERIAQARAARQVVAAQGLPHLDAQGSYRRERASPNGLNSLIEPVPGAPLDYSLYRPMITAGWELDLFGRVRRAAEAADADIDAMAAARNGLALSAIAELVQDYCELRLRQAQEALVRRNIAIADQRRDLIRIRIADGVATTLDFAQADAQGLAIAEDLPTLRAQQSRAINAMSLLLAEPPRSLAAELSPPVPQPMVPPSVPIGLPSELTRRRPDVREAEARLHAATAQTGVAVASFYPDVTLAGDFGFDSLHLGNLFSLDSRRFSIGPSIDLPIFQGGRLTGTLEVREGQQREAALRFRQTVLRAWHEVDNALTAYVEAQHRQADAESTNRADARVLDVADQQYRRGVASLLNVIAAQESVLRSETAIAMNRAQVEMRLVDLYKALGGGWEVVAR